MRRLIALGLCLSSLANADDKPEKPDLAVIHRIKDEAFRRGQVMDHLFWLTDANGPRLTGSPGFKSAADWAVKTLAGWGASQSRLESWGKFGRSWAVTLDQRREQRVRILSVELVVRQVVRLSAPGRCASRWW
jgi:hypothetical protein